MIYIYIILTPVQDLLDSQTVSNKSWTGVNIIYMYISVMNPSQQGIFAGKVYVAAPLAVMEVAWATAHRE